MGKDRVHLALLGLLVLSGAGLLAGRVHAEGTESLDTPGIATAPATGLVTAGSGAVTGSGILEFAVPAGTTVQQVLLYWTGFATTPSDLMASRPNELPAADELSQSVSAEMLVRSRAIAGPSATNGVSAATVWDATRLDAEGGRALTVNGIAVHGDLIGGPTYYSSSRQGMAYRADITTLNLVHPGVNVLSVAGVDFSAKSDGIGVVVLYDDGVSDAQIMLRDGHDLANLWLAPPLNTTVAQTIHFAPTAYARSGQVKLFVGNVGPGQPTEVQKRITVGWLTWAMSAI
ncbi:MAG TPA: hypothetical protein P5572_10960 [Phycisphaerae bacterium]|nr:hypothetical protein [Phycisphaerae bacterium]